MLELLKKLLNIEDDTQDDILKHYLEQAKNTACIYCNVASLPEQFDGAVIDLAVYLYSGKDYGQIKTKKQGERTVAYFKPVDIPDGIKAALPLPKIRVIGDVL